MDKFLTGAQRKPTNNTTSNSTSDWRSKSRKHHLSCLPLGFTSGCVGGKE